MRLYIGIDISKDTLDICILKDDKKEFIKIFNNQKSIEGFLSFLELNYSLYVYRFGYEATNTYMNVLAKVLTNKNYLHKMLNPHSVNHYLTYLDKKTKTDISDSYGIAKLLSTLSDDEFNTSYDEQKLIFSKYNATLKLIEKITTQIKNLKQSQKEIKIDELDSFIDELELKLKELKKKIHLKATKIMHDIFPQTKQIQKEIKGVGSALLLSLSPVFFSSHKYTLKQIQSYFGLSPKTYESGSSVKKKERISKFGNGDVRKMLYMSAMSAIRHNEIIKEKYQRLIKKGKEKMVAMVACMTHLLRAIFTKFHEYSIQR